MGTPLIRAAALAAVLTATAPCLAAPAPTAATEGEAGPNIGRWERACSRELAGFVSAMYSTRGASGSRASAALRLAKGLGRKRLGRLAFPGASERARFVAEGASVLGGRRSGVGASRISWVAWRDGNRFAVIADIDGRGLCYAYSVPGRQLTALLVRWGKAGGADQPSLVWSAKCGLRVVGLATVDHQTRRLSAKVGLRVPPQPGVGLTALTSGWVWGFFHLPPGDRWAHGDPGLLVRFRRRGKSVVGVSWNALGTDRSVPGGASGYLLVSGLALPLRASMPDGPWRWTALALAVAPLAAHARSKYFPACSEAPAKMRGMRVEEVGAGVLGKALMAPFLLSAASQLSAGHRDEAELSHFHRLDENPHAVAAFLKWVGGGSAAWYQHQGVRRLREICKAGAALHGRSGR